MILQPLAGQNKKLLRQVNIMPPLTNLRMPIRKPVIKKKNYILPFILPSVIAKQIMPPRLPYGMVKS
jgi:hypothetical protein